MGGLLQDAVAHWAVQTPDVPAIVMHDVTTTYGQLEAESNRMARLLVDVGCGRADRVALLCDKSPAAITAMLATLKAGCAYVPIDVASPATRVEHVLRAAEPRVLLADESATTLLDQLSDAIPSDAVIGALDGDAMEGRAFSSRVGRADWAEYAPDGRMIRAHEQDPAHILFTSGSTGVPKGVTITHANVTAFVRWANSYFKMGVDDRWSGHPPLHFDLSTYDVYGTFACGAQLHPVPTSLNLLPHKLAGFIREARLTRWFSVPSTLAFMTRFGAIKHDDFPHLRQLLWCGEVLPVSVLMDLMERLPHVQFTNLYGPTEATIASSYHTVTERPATAAASVPIGVPCDGEELVILDDELREVGTDAVGDLYIGGVGLSPGYWRDEEKTRAVFVSDPRPEHDGSVIYRTGDLVRRDLSGLIHFIGRADSQIKHRGYRIELGEIETAMTAIDAIQECAVVATPTDRFEGTVICCAYASDPPGVPPRELRAQLAERLPSYMLPTRWRSMDQLPTNVNGKIDRKALRQWFDTHDG